MRIYPEEWECAQRYQAEQVVPRFSEAQMNEIRAIGKSFTKWYRSHPHLHNAIGVAVLLLLFAVDAAVLLRLPQQMLGTNESALRFAASLCLTSVLHGFVFYSVVIYSMHEGAAHDRIILRTGPVSILLNLFANNACRLFYADPIYYRSRHTHHHADFATQDDGAFTNFVHPRRFWISLLPFAGVLDFNDYRIHTDTTFSLSRLCSFLIGTAYAVLLGVWMVPAVGWTYTLLVLVVFAPWVAFVLDRLRETTEHNLMPLETPHGARNLGCGFWGVLVGGGLWGQPCHLSHHLIPALPWYQQCLLHRRLLKIMTPAQRRYFTVAPFVGFPKLLAHVVRQNHRWLRTYRDGVKAGQSI